LGYDIYEGHDYVTPNRLWSPWIEGNFTKDLKLIDKFTIEINQTLSAPFELILSNNKNPDAIDSYSIKLIVSETQASINKVSNNSTFILNQTKYIDTFLHKDHGSHTYWLSIDSNDLLVKYGQGEVRDKLTIMKCKLDKEHLKNQIQYLHVKFNNTTDLSKLKDLEDTTTIKFCRFSVANHDPPLFIIKRSTPTCEVKTCGLEFSGLAEPYGTLYKDVISWRLADEFEQFTEAAEAIHRSVTNPDGWCFQKLQMKSQTFGDKPNILGTYLRITIGENNFAGSRYVLEIWPPLHYSPIRAHTNALGIVHVLYGQVNIQLFASLNVEHQVPFHNATLEKNNVTWLSPGLNQIRKIMNPSHDETAIVIQTYRYGKQDYSGYEYFDYIDNDDRQIKSFLPKTDLEYVEFKKIIIREWNDDIAKRNDCP
ncbi:unnamed protein product, partial [Didymodactylos carnosus]